jgi:hypothetical protein
VRGMHCDIVCDALYCLCTSTPMPCEVQSTHLVAPSRAQKVVEAAAGIWLDAPPVCEAHLQPHRRDKLHQLPVLPAMLPHRLQQSWSGARAHLRTAVQAAASATTGI